MYMQIYKSVHMDMGIYFSPTIPSFWKKGLVRFYMWVYGGIIGFCLLFFCSLGPLLTWKDDVDDAI